MKKGTLILAASIVAVLVGFFVFSRFFVDLLWFSSLGFRAVFTTTWLTALEVFVVATGLSSAILLLNGFIAARATPAGPRRQPSFRVIGRGTQGMPEIIELSLDKLPWRLIIARGRFARRLVHRFCPNGQLGHASQMVLCRSLWAD